MGFKNPAYDLLTAYYQLLSATLSVPVYKGQAPTDVTGNYVVVRIEGTSSERNKHLFLTTVTIITEVVTAFAASVNTKTANDIEGEITQLLLPTPNSYGISLTDFNLYGLKLQSTVDQIEEADQLYYVKISRWENIINQ